MQNEPNSIGHRAPAHSGLRPLPLASDETIVPMNMIHENLSASIESLAARMIAIRDSL